jgi:hypothetical protein
VDYEQQARHRIAQQRAVAEADAARKAAELDQLIQRGQRQQQETRDALRKWVVVAHRERLPTHTLVLRARLGGLLGAAEVREVWTLSDYHEASPAEGNYLMSPGSPEVLGTAIDRDARLYGYRKTRNRSELLAARDKAGRLCEPHAPACDQETLELMFEAVLDGWWSNLNLLKNIKREHHEDRFRFRSHRL